MTELYPLIQTQSLADLDIIRLMEHVCYFVHVPMFFAREIPLAGGLLRRVPTPNERCALLGNSGRWRMEGGLPFYHHLSQICQPTVCQMLLSVNERLPRCPKTSQFLNTTIFSVKMGHLHTFTSPVLLFTFAVYHRLEIIWTSCQYMHASHNHLICLQITLYLPLDCEFQ